ncbi:MAG: sulfatase-like hydrolase/transferase, partial [Bryobacteraceae bacterium]
MVSRRQLLSLAGASTFAPAGVPPNILFVIVDDLGWADVGFHGAEIETPNLDRLARGGVEFRQHY